MRASSFCPGSAGVEAEEEAEEEAGAGAEGRPERLLGELRLPLLTTLPRLLTLEPLWRELWASSAGGSRGAAPLMDSEALGPSSPS